MEVERFTNAILAILIIILIAVNILMALTINGDLLNKRGGENKGDVISSDYFSTINPWGDTSYTNTPNPLGIDTSVCNWFTYENVYNITKNPNIANAFSDFENGFSHLSPAQSCIDQDQIVFRTATKTCDGTGTADCIGAQGERYNRNTVQNFNSSCGGKDLPACDSTTGSLTFNFLQDFITSDGGTVDLASIDSGTRFMTFSKIYVSQSTYNKIASSETNQFYINEGGLFQPSLVLNPKNDEYFPLIRFLGKQDSNFKQNIKIVRYSFQPSEDKTKSGSYISDSQGPYGEILFRPQQLYLDIKINETSGQLTNGGFSIVTNDLSGIQNQYLDADVIRKILSGTSYYGDTCTAIVIGGVATVTIYKAGTHTYSGNEVLSIQNDDLSGSPLQIKVTKTVDYSNYFILSQTSKKWLLIPPMDIGGGQIIPREDRTSRMRSMNKPLDPGWLNYLFNHYTGHSPRRDGNETLCFGKLPSPDPQNSEVFGELLYSGGGKDLSVKEKDQYLFRNFKQNIFGSNDSDLNPRNNPPGFGFWWDMAERNQYAVGGVIDKDTGKTLSTNAYFEQNLGSIASPLYPDNYVENSLVATNKVKGSVDNTSSDFFTLYGYRGDKNDSPTCGVGRCPYFKCSISYWISYPKNPPTSYTKTYIDGNVTWNIVNNKSLINVFGIEYFSQATNQGGPISDFNIINKGNGFKSPQTGTVIYIDWGFFSINSGNIPQSGTYKNITLVGTSSNCKVDITVQQGTISGVSIVNPGSGYSDGESCSATIQVSSTENLKIDNLVVLVSDSDYRYVAIPTDIDGNPLPPTSTTSIFTYGLVIDPSKVKIVSGQLTLGTNKPQNSILYGGTGYTIGDNIQIDQVDQDGISAIVGTKAIIKVSNVLNSNEPVRVPSLYSSNLQNPIPDDFITYNFYKQDPNLEDKQQPVYNQSPQQIGYIPPSLEKDINLVITTGGEDQFKTFLFTNSPGGILSSVNMLTLQFPKLNYRQIYNDPANGSVQPSNVISSNDSLTVGKFIPYTSFSSAKRNKEDLFYNYDLYTTNDVRFIPNSITDIYIRKFSKTGKNAVPTF